MKRALKNGSNVVTNNLPKLKAAFDKLSNRGVYVGIPADKAARSDSGGMNNATIGYIAEHGAPEAGVPARRWLAPGIKNAGDGIATQLKSAAKAQMKNDEERVEQHLNRAGMIAATSCKKIIDEGLSPALKPATILGRRHGRGTKSMRKSEKAYQEAMKGGMNASEAQAAAGVKPYINTRQFFRSITYVLRSK